MFGPQFFVHNGVLYQETEIEAGYHSLPTLVLDDLKYLDGLLIVIQLLLDIYDRVESIKFLSTVINMYELRVDQDIILIYPYDFGNRVKDEFIELNRGDLFELCNLLTEEVCDAK